MIDIAIIGGGPGGLQAALVLARTRKHIVVFDSPTPPRNGASHGVHNVLGLDGMLPAEIRELAWEQLHVYPTVDFRQDVVERIEPGDEGFIITTHDSQQLAKKVIMAFGFRDEFPAVNGYTEAWADTIIPCPFCDGYENRDRDWGVVVSSDAQAAFMPLLVQNWTSSICTILRDAAVTLDQTTLLQLEALGIPVHTGPIVAIEQRDGTLNSATLASGDKIEVETLWWVPDRVRTDLEIDVIQTFGLKLDESGLMQIDENNQTATGGLYAVGDLVRGGPSAMGAIEDGNKVAIAIIKGWYM